MKAVSIVPDESNDTPSRPISVGCADLLQRLGVDCYNREDMRDLAAAIRWAGEERARQAKREILLADEKRERRSRLYAVGFGLVATAIGGIGTWLVAHTTIGFLG